MATYSKEELRHIFQSPFNQEAWKAILQNLFRVDKLRTKPEPFTDPSDNEEGFYMGATETSDAYRIGLFYYKIKNGSVAHKKVGLRNLVKKFINQNWGEFDAAIVVFDSKPEWRLSFVCDIKEQATAPKRFTFVFGEHDNRYRTPIERFEKLQNQEATFENIRKAFSVDALSDDFFNTYRDLYADFVQFITGKRYAKEGSKWFERELGRPDSQYETTFYKDDKLVRDYIKKMFGRIVFLYFLQRKGWLNGNRNYMHDLFANSDKKDNFLDGVLGPLFFEVLNTDKPYRTTEARALPGIDNIPYLNGGLFARDEIDERTCIFPENFFARLFDFLDSYNFTIDENDTEDAEIGIDPEMLGRIFENLLEDNKDKGAFYTPKEIVNYMCRESIIAYLQNDKFTPEGNDKIRHFVETYDGERLSLEQRVYLKDKLKAVKICDPAIGSGAFPMGLVNLLAKLYSALRISTETAVIKRHIMEKSIYGVDIEKGAVDIARLRFWLAMIVEEKEPMPLPNLHFKIMQGNSLLESYQGIDLSDLTKVKAQRGLFDSDDFERESLAASLREYYKTSDHAKRDRLFNDIINNVRRQLFTKQITLPTGEDPSANTNFFLWHTWFSDVFANGGFDIVIGNPPYVLVQNMPISESKKRELVKDSIVAQYKVDLYHLFIERASNLLNDSGILSFINPTNFLTNNYTNLLREFILKNKHLVHIINITENVFQASVNTGIFFIKNKDLSNSVRYSSCNILDGNLSFTTLSECKRDKYIESTGCVIQPIGNKKVQDILDKIDSISFPLKKMASVNFGIQLRNRKIFETDVLENPQIDQLTQFHRPCLTGKDVFPFASTFNNRYCYFNREAKCGGCWDEVTHNTLIKVLVRQVGAIPVCGIDTNGYAILNSVFMITSKTLNPYAILGIVNSKPIAFYWQQKFEDKRKTFPKIKGTYLELIPIPTELCEQFIQVSKRRSELSFSGGLSEDVKSVFDVLSFKIFQLTYDEVLIVDPETPISREEYENFNIEDVCLD